MSYRPSQPRPRTRRQAGEDSDRQNASPHQKERHRVAEHHRDHRADAGVTRQEGRDQETRGPLRAARLVSHAPV